MWFLSLLVAGQWNDPLLSREDDYKPHPMGLARGQSMDFIVVDMPQYASLAG
jgi:hypothetical protein